MTTITRRNALRLGLSALAAGVTTSGALALGAPRSASATRSPARACIVLYMVGGASQIDTWDPKPGRPTGGEFRSIRTSIPGVHVSEHLPRLARRADRLAILRSLTYREGNHARARYLMHTGYVPAGATRHPSLGAQLAEHRADGVPLPPHVAIGGPGHTAGLMGPQWSPFVVGNPHKPVRNLESSVETDRMDARLQMWESLQSDFAQHRNPRAVQGHQDIVQQAVSMMRAEEVEAFDVEQESTSTRGRYGPSKFAQGCLMARRLVERGVPFVEVQMGGWDTHDDNFGRVRTLSADLDAAMAALLDDLDASGMLGETLIVWTGDFGRTPRINARGGRDHFPHVASAVLAGGGIAGGQVIGATDANGEAVLEDPITPADFHRTVQTRLGLDADAVRLSSGGRPVYAVDGGRVIESLE